MRSLKVSMTWVDLNDSNQSERWFKLEWKFARFESNICMIWIIIEQWLYNEFFIRIKMFGNLNQVERGEMLRKVTNIDSVQEIWWFKSNGQLLLWFESN